MFKQLMPRIAKYLAKYQEAKDEKSWFINALR